MGSLASWVGMLDLATGLTELAVQWLVQSTLIIAIGLTAAALMRHRAPAVRSAIYQSTLLATLVCPVVAYMLAGFGWTFVSVQLPSAVVETVVEVAVESPAEPKHAVQTTPVAPAAPTKDLAANDQQGLSQADEIERGIDRKPSFTVLPFDPSIPASGRMIPAPEPAPTLPLPAPATVKQIVITTRPLLAAAVLGVSLIWAIGSLLLLGRILLQHLQLARLRHGAAASDEVIIELCAQLAARMEVPPPQLLVSPFVGSPCLAGILRPAILLPEELPNVPLSAVLVHELAHRKRRDCLWNLLRQVTVALLYLQPLAWRLSRRLEAVAEEVCDDYVVQLGEDRQAYAETLLNLAERNFWPASEAVVSLVTFRSVLSERVLRILDRSRRLSLTVGLAALCIIGVSGLSAALLAGLLGRGPQTVAATIQSKPEELGEAIEPDPADTGTAEESTTNESAKAGSEAAQAKVEEAAVTKLDTTEAPSKSSATDKPSELRGRVLDPAGKPMAGAEVKVHVITSSDEWTPWELAAIGQSDADGNFKLDLTSFYQRQHDLPSDKFGGRITASAPGFGKAWIGYHPLSHEQEITLHLVRDEPIIGRLLNLEGQPVAGVRVKVKTIATNWDGDNLSRWIADLRNRGEAAQHGSLQPTNWLGHHVLDVPPRLDPVAIEAISDATGQFRITGVGRGRLATFKLSGGGAVIEQLQAFALPVPEVRFKRESLADAAPVIYQGAHFQHIVTAARPIEGVVRDAASGQPLPGVRIWSQQIANVNALDNHLLQTVSDEAGRYRIDELPPGKGNRLIAIPRDDQPYLMHEVNVPVAEGAGIVQLDLKLHQGVWITGRVTDQQTGQPVAGKLHYLPWPDNALGKELPEFNYHRTPGRTDRYQVDAGGNYRLVGLPGKGLVILSAPQGSAYPVCQGLSEIADLPPDDDFRRMDQQRVPRSVFNTAIKEVRIADDAKEVNVNFQLARGKRLQLKVVGTAGNLLTQVDCAGLVPVNGFGRSTGDEILAVTELGPTEKRQLNLIHPASKLGKALVVNTPATDGEVQTIQLEPCATITGRVLDNFGEPVADAEIRVYYPAAYHFVSWLGNVSAACRLKTDTDGRFKTDLVPPGVVYEVSCESPRFRDPPRIIENLTVAPGETIDLGEFDVTAKTRPEPKRTLAKAEAKAEGDYVEEPFEYSGKVIDADGRPVPGAILNLVTFSPTDVGPPTKLVPQPPANDKGEFKLSITPPRPKRKIERERRGVGYLFAEAPGLIRDKILLSGANTGQELTFRLAPDEPIAGRIVDLEGQPVLGVRVEVESVSTNEQGDLSAWLEQLRKGSEVDPTLKVKPSRSLDRKEHERPPALNPTNFSATTDVDGRFKLTGIGRGRLAQLNLSGGGIVIDTLSVIALPMKPIRAENEGRMTKSVTTYFGSTFQYAALRSQPIEGIVRDAKTKEPLAGVMVQNNGLPRGVTGGGLKVTQTVSDAAGRFRLDGMPPGKKNRVYAMPAEDQPYFVRDFVVPETPDFETARVELELHRGVFITGRVIDQSNGDPVESELLYLPWPDNAWSQELPEFNDGVLPWRQHQYCTDREGRYRLVGLPGRGLVMARTQGHQPVPFVTCQGLNEITDLPPDEEFKKISQLFIPRGSLPTAIQQLRIEPNAMEVTADFQLTHGKSKQLKLVDPEGTPLAGTTARGLLTSSPAFESNLPIALGPVEAIGPGEQRHVVLLHTQRKLGKALTVTADDADPITVQLEPCATVSGRILDKDRQPVAGAKIRFIYRTPSDHFGLLPESESDSEGCFKIDTLPAGLTYNIRCEARSIGTQFPAENLTVAAGETIDLGEFDVTAKERPEPKRTLAKSETDAQGNYVDEPFEYSGKVIDAEGKAVPGATLYLVNYGPSDTVSPTNVVPQPPANDEGEFKLSFTPTRPKRKIERERRAVGYLFADAPGLIRDRLLIGGSNTGKELIFRLVPDEPIAGRIVDLEGQPVPGVRVEVDRIHNNEQGDLSDWIKQLREGVATGQGPIPKPNRWVYIKQEGAQGAPLASTILTATTDTDGRFNLAGIGRGRLAEIKLAGGGIVVDTLAVIALPMAPIRGETEGLMAKSTTTYFGSTFQYAALRSQPIEGIVRDAKTKEPLAGVKVQSDKFSTMQSHGHHAAQTVSDAKGRYRLEGMPPGEGASVIAVPGNDQPYFLSEFDVPATPDFESAKLDLELHRGVWITGCVTDQVTGDPVEGEFHYLPWPDNPLSQKMRRFNQGYLPGLNHRISTDRDGRYRLVGLPGRGLVMFLTQGYQPISYVTGQGLSAITDLPPDEEFKKISQIYTPRSGIPTAIQQVRIEPNAPEVTADFQLSRGKSRQLAFVDPAGQPISGVHGNGLSPNDHRPGKLVSTTTIATVEALSPGENRDVVVWQPERKFGKALIVKAAAEDNTPITVQLEPSGTVSGRILDKEREPVAGAKIVFTYRTPSNQRGVLPEFATDGDGRFTINTLPAGLIYNVRCEARGIGTKFAVDNLSVASGESIDLGEFDVTAKARPEPKRTLAKAETAASLTSIVATASEAASSDVFDFAGQVLDPNGKPVPGAKLFVLYYTPTLIETKLRAVSTAEGRFQFRMAKAEFDTASSDAPWELAYVMAGAPGYGVAWASASGFEKSGEILKAKRSKANYLGDDKMLGLDGILKLAADSLPIEGRVLNLEGQPVVGASVKLVEIRRSREGNLDAWLKAMQEAKLDEFSIRQLAPMGLSGTHINHQLAQVIPPLLTDREGRFRLTGIGPERLVSVQISGAGIESRQVLARTQAGGTLQVLRSQSDPRVGMVRYYGAKFDHVSALSRPVRGVVRDHETGLALPGVTVTAERLAGELISGWSNSYIRATTDAEGRYELTGLPIGTNSLQAFATGDEPYLPAELAVETTPSEAAATLDFALHKGVWIRGRVTDAGTGRPVRARVGYFTFANNPQLKLAPGMRPADPYAIDTDADGRFAARGLPGRGILGVLANDDQNYPRGAGAEAIDGQGSAGKKGLLETVPHYLHVMDYHAVHEVNPAEGATEVTQDFVLQAGQQLAGEVQDADGLPLSGVMIAGNTEFANWRPTNGQNFVVHLVRPNTPRRLQFYHTEKKLAGTMLMTGNEKEPLVMRLAPWGIAQGRVLQENGDAADSFVLMGGSLVQAMTPDFGILPIAQGTRTNADGRFTIEGLAPGAKYKISAIKDNFGHGVIIDEFEVASGETKDLGDLNIHPSQQITGMAVFTPAPAPAPTKAPTMKSAIRLDVVIQEDAAPAPPKSPAMKKPAEKSVPPAEQSPAGEKLPAATLSPAGTSSLSPAADEERVEFIGTVLDARGKPTPGAKVSLLHGSLHKWSIEPAVETLADGTFKIEVSKKRLAAHEPITGWPWGHIIVSAAGQGVTWASAAHFEKSGEMLAALKKRKDYTDVEQLPSSGRTLQLVDDLPLTGRMVNLEGQGVAGLKVEVIELRGNAENNLDPWLTAVQDPKATLGYAWKLLPQALQGTNLYQQYATLLPSTTTDSDGRFTLAGLGRERVARLQIRGATTETRILYARTRSGPGIEGIHDRHYEYPFTCYGSQIDIALAPSQPVAGTVRDADTALPLGGVTIQAKLPGHWTTVHIETVTDADGHYVLTGLPLSENEIVAMPPADEPYIVAERSVETAPLDKPPTIDFKLKRGVWIEGRVADAETDKPLSAQIEYFAFLDNPARKAVRGTLSAQHRFIATDAEGRYRVCALPGPGLVGARLYGGDPQYPRGTGGEKIVAGRVDDIPGGGIHFGTAPFICNADNYHGLVEINPATDTEPQTCDFTIQASKALAGTLLDPQGEPLSGVVLYDMLSFTSPRPLTAASFAVYNLQPGKPRLLTCRHVERRLAGSLLVKGDETEPLTIQLAPWGTVTGRLMLSTGDAAANVTLHGGSYQRVREGKFGALPGDGILVTDTDGRFTIEGLSPGVNYSLSASKKNVHLGDAIDVFQVAPGETKDLGELTLNPNLNP